MLLAVLPILFDGGDTSQMTKVPAPGIEMRRNMAMATSAPWVDSNVWQYRRAPGKHYFCDVAGKSVALAMAEAHSQGIELALKTTPDQRKEYDQMAAFLKSVPEGPKQVWANISVADDGSQEAGEAMNLLSRRNLLFKTTPDPKAALQVKLDASIMNPYDFAQELRQKLGEERRMVRLYGSEITIADLRRDGPNVRLSLINYGRRAAESLRVRVRGHYSKSIRAYVYGAGEMQVTDYAIDGGFTEFSIPKLPLYAVIDLRAEAPLP